MSLSQLWLGVLRWEHPAMCSQVCLPNKITMGYPYALGSSSTPAVLIKSVSSFVLLSSWLKEFHHCHHRRYSAGEFTGLCKRCCHSKFQYSPLFWCPRTATLIQKKGGPPAPLHTHTLRSWNSGLKIAAFHPIECLKTYLSLEAKTVEEQWAFLTLTHWCLIPFTSKKN